jgi:exosortase/archaeosortase family protein
MPHELNARIGRSMAVPWFDALPAAPASKPPAATLIRAARRLPHVAWLSAALLGALLAALWPHWIYVARRMTDGSDEPWGVLAIATFLVLVVHDRALLVTPGAAALVASAVLAVFAAVASLMLPNLVAAAIAMAAVAVFTVSALRARPAAPLAGLLLLSLPIIASLHFYLGYPLRVVAAAASSVLLNALGVSARAAGATIVSGDATVLIDAPCAGIGMLWVGSYAAALLSYLQRADAARTAVNAAAACMLVLAANVLRNTALFFPEAGLVSWPAWSHDAAGLAAFVCALVPLAIFITWRRA